MGDRDGPGTVAPLAHLLSMVCRGHRTRQPHVDDPAGPTSGATVSGSADPGGPPVRGLHRTGRPRAVRFVAGVLTAFAALVVTAAPASAHAALVRSDPRDGIDLARAPLQVSLTFDEAVGLRPGYLQVIDGTGRRVDIGTAFHPPGSDDVVTVHLRPGLGRAAYVASYRVISADSHPVSGAVEFTVGGANPATVHPAGRSTGVVVSVLFDAARSVTFCGLALCGGVWLLLLARRPRYTNPEAPSETPADARPERSRREPIRSWLSVRYGAILALGGLGIEFLLQGPYAAGKPVTAVTDPTLLGDTFSSAFGRLHLAAIVLICCVSAAAVRLRREAWVAVVWAFGWVAVLAAVAASGHAGVRAPVWLGLPLTVAHLLAMTTWIGGLAVLVLRPRVRRPDDVEWRTDLLAVFSRVAMACVATLAVTGTYQAWQELGSWPALFDTTYGRLVLTKIELFGVLVALGAVARARVAARSTGPGTTTPQLGLGRATVPAQLRTGILLELAVAAAVLCVSGVLVAEPPGRGAALASPTARSATVTAQLSLTRTVTVRVSPDRHGPVTIQLTVSPGPAVQKLTVTAAQTAAGVGPLPVAVHAGVSGYRSGPVDLPVAGNWRFTVTVQTSQFDIATATPTLELT